MCVHDTPGTSQTPLYSGFAKPLQVPKGIPKPFCKGALQSS